jgi:general secretion pathway protein C
METYFRKYFWTAHLAFISLAALIVAKTINLFVESAILGPPRGDAPRAVARRTAAQPVARLDFERIARLTGLPLPKEPEVQEPDQPALDPNAAPVKSGLRVKLIGTMAATISKWSIASILDLGTQRAQTYGIGHRVLGAEVLEILRERVIVLNNNRREYISNEMEGAVAAYVPPNPGRLAHGGEPPPSGLGTGIKSISDSEYEVPRGEIDKILANLNELSMQARMVLAFKDGQANGFKLFSIRPDSLYTKIGIQNGDVIRRINGNDINSVEKALEVYSRLRDASRIDIDIERNGNNLRKTYNIR